MTDDNTQHDPTTEEQLAQMTETAKRALADLQNFKRRAEEERADLQVYANMQLLSAIFPAIDNMQRAMESIPEELKNNEWVKGVAATEASLLQALTTLGLETIDQKGVPVDPHKHEVLMEASGPKGEVLQIFEKGYLFKGKTIRPAKVQVGSGE